VAEDYLEEDTWAFVDWLRDYIEEQNPLNDDASMFSDLIGHALANVQYGDIAEGILDELRESESC